MIEGIVIPRDLAAAIEESLARIGSTAAYAVRSSATTEDSPTTSFAGQHDTYLNVVGTASIMQHIARCWASLFSERAVTYRLRNGVDNRKTSIAVVVQQMVFPQAAGVLFTADPITGNRKVTAVEAIVGLGEALVSGLTNADVYKVRDGEIIETAIATKQLAVSASPAGGTQQRALTAWEQQQPALTDSQVVQLAAVGRRIEAHFGRPQDIEWCLVDGEFHIVQSRPITTLFPIPEQNDGENHVYVSVGHQQMMTDPLKPLGLAVWQLTTPRPMAEAGGRLFVDVTPMLASPASRESLLATLGKSDPLIRDALETVLARGNFIRLLPDAGPAWTPPGKGAASLPTDPGIVAELIERTEASIAELKRDIQSKSGAALFDFIRADIQERKQIQSDPRSLQVVMAGMEAAWWLNEHLETWLGEKNLADTFTQSAPNNVTSEMGLALLDVADVIRPHPEVVASLERASNEDFLNTLSSLPGGKEAHDVIEAWLAKYGMRCVGEIDITRPRWRERPSTLLPVILSNVKNFGPGAAKQRFEHGLRQAETKEAEVLARLRALPDGAQKAEETERMIERVRTFAGYREYPKYRMISRYFIYKEALLKEATRLVDAGVLRDTEESFYLRFDEFQEAVRTHQVDEQLIRRRKEAFESYDALTPPRVLTSDGEGLGGSYRRSDFPDGALVGLAVSAGSVEGRARVILNISDADLEPGDILVTTFTDPSWTPLFVAIKGLVTEVGGLMTHGAVIAREYGLPAVVGVEHATRRIRDGQRIRVHGTEGYVELLA
jgi:pyruvate,water dikinase